MEIGNWAGSLEKDCSVCVNDPLTQNGDRELSSEKFVTLVINGNIKFLKWKDRKGKIKENVDRKVR